ncbi:MAG: dTDP-glucose 4,6-dehydratase [Desulfobacteraceae bacterium]
MTTTLVTGGAGFIGSNFIHYLNRKNPDHKIINLDLLTYAGNPENLADLEDSPHYTFIQGDIADQVLVHSLFQRYPISRVVHFAAESHVDRSIMSPAVFMRTNVQGTFALLEAARQAWIEGNRGLEEEPRFLQVSTDEVYGSLTHQQPAFTESSPYAPNSPYAASKAAGDMLARAYHKTYGLPVIITNSSNNYGPYQFPEKFIPLIITQALGRKPIPVYGQGDNIRDWLYVEDHCRALEMVLENGRGGQTYNIGARNEHSNLDVVYQVLQLLQDCQPGSNSLKDLITFVKDRPGHDWRYALDTTKINQEIGWQPEVDFTAGLKRTIDWYLEHRGWINRIQSGAYRDYLVRQYGRSTV